MNAIELLRQPATVLLVFAAVLLAFGLLQLLAARRSLDAGSRLAAAGRTLACVVLWVLAVGLGAGGVALRGYRVLDRGTPVVEVEAHILSPQHWALVLAWPDGSTRRVDLVGDAWRVDAVLLRGVPGSWLARLPAVYRLDRVEARVDGPSGPLADAPGAAALRGGGMFDLAALRTQFPAALAAVDATYDRLAFQPLVDGGHYGVQLAADGQLVAQPDAATAQRISSPLGQ